MKKEFNVTGTCNSLRHYVMNNSRQFAGVLDLLERGKYFVINRPRQYGKTTMLSLLLEYLRTREDYVAIRLNFQGIDRKWHESDTLFAQMFVQLLEDFFEFSNENTAKFIKQASPVTDMNSLSKFITRLMMKLDKKVVLLIDEVDASSNYDAFLSFLAMLRSKFLVRDEGELTFHSVVLAGVHDIKSLKFKIRKEDTETNSPWNIATDFTIEMGFYPNEIVPMLEQYSEAEGVLMDFGAIAERLYYHTSGYPFLISKLCKNIAEIILPQKEDKTVWTLDDVEGSVKLLLREQNTNFDSLIKNLENNSDLKDLIRAIVLDGALVGFNQYNRTLSKGMLYGILQRNGKVKIHNRIYEQLIYQYLASEVEIQQLYSQIDVSELAFKTKSNGLNFEKILKRFVRFMQEEYSSRDVKFLEREWRLLFLAFLRPIVNGEGYTFKEVQISEERRLDVVVTYFQHRYIVELKKWYGGEYHEKGLNQLCDYLEIHGVSEGFLVIFDERRKKVWETEEIFRNGKRIFAAWV